MINNLRDILYDEEKELKELLILLDKQYKLIIAKDIFGMESIVEDIKQKNKDVAEIEVSRRRLLGNQSIKEVILNSKDEE